MQLIHWQPAKSDCSDQVLNAQAINLYSFKCPIPMVVANLSLGENCACIISGAVMITLGTLKLTQTNWLIFKIVITNQLKLTGFREKNSCVGSSNCKNPALHYECPHKASSVIKGLYVPVLLLAVESKVASDSDRVMSFHKSEHEELSKKEFT